MGQFLAPRAFGSKKCVVRAFVATPDTHSRFSFWSSEGSREPKVLLEELYCRPDVVTFLFGPVKPLENLRLS